MKQKSLTKDVRQCPRCNKDEFRFVLGKSSFRLKGEGWYKDGYT